MDNLRRSARNPLNMATDSQAVDAAIFGPQGGSLDQLDSGRVVVKPMSIFDIWADPKQPRRALPLNIRMHWNGNPNDVPALLRQLHQVAEAAASQALDVVALLNGEGEGLDSDKFPSVAEEYLSLVRLGQNIKANGLINPITVVESDGRHLIESGERRWLAYHLLHMHLGEQWAKIPAAKGSRTDSVWRQATENTARRQLNAIGMARQIALLIMAARGTPPMESGQQYKEYDEIVTPGVCDRRFYAQVADGSVHRIPKGMGERIQGAMGLGMEQISYYRALLRLTPDELVNDVLWTRADIENWPEGWMREIRTLTPVKVSEVLQRSEWSIDDLRALKVVPVDRPPTTIGGQPQQIPQRPAVQPPTRPIPVEWLGKHVMTKSGITGKVIEVQGDWIQVLKDADRQKKSFFYQDLTFIAPPAPTPLLSSPWDSPFAIGDKVRTRTGHEGEVVSISGRLIGVKTINGTTAHDRSLLSKIVTPQIDEDDIEPDVDPDEPPPAREWSEGWTESIGGVNFRVGDRISTTNGRSGGVVLAVEGGQVQVEFPGSDAWWDDSTNFMLIERPEISSDKADSQPPQARLLFPLGSDDWCFLDALNDLAVMADDSATVAALSEINTMTDVEAIRLQDAQLLKPKLDQAFDQLKAAMQVWLDGPFASILQKVMDAAQ